MSKNKEDESSSLINFMHKKHKEKKSPTKRENKTEKSLREAKEEREAKKKKDVDEAKNESMFKASRYNQSQAMNRRIKSFSILYPLAIMGAILAFIVILKAGPIFSKIISSLIQFMLGK